MREFFNNWLNKYICIYADILILLIIKSYLVYPMNNPSLSDDNEEEDQAIRNLPGLPSFINPRIISVPPSRKRKTISTRRSTISINSQTNLFGNAISGTSGETSRSMSWKNAKSKSSLMMKPNIFWSYHLIVSGSSSITNSHNGISRTILIRANLAED